MSELMKIKNLKNYGIPSHIVDICEKDYSRYLLRIQEEAVRNYGILSCGEGSTGLPRRFTPRNDKKEETSRNHPHPALSPQGRGKKKTGVTVIKIFWLSPQPPQEKPSSEKWRQ